MKIKDKSLGIFSVEMKTIDTNTWLNIEEQFSERGVVFKFKISRQFFWFEDEFFLYEIGNYR